MLIKNKGFSLIEVLVVIFIIGILATVSFVGLTKARVKARDVKRINDITEIGRFLSSGCLVPTNGPGEYDLNELISELKNKYPQYSNLIPSNINDPKTSSDQVSNYKYLVNGDNKCALYANLENDKQTVNLPNISAPTPGGGSGIFAAQNAGWNGSNKYFQMSN